MKMFQVYFESPTVLTAIETTGAQSIEEIEALLPQDANSFGLNADSKTEAITKALKEGFFYISPEEMRKAKQQLIIIQQLFYETL